MQEYSYSYQKAMASSQVEIASSAFGCVLRDRNQGDVFRERKWREFLVKDHLSIERENENDNENSWHQQTQRLSRNNESGFIPSHREKTVMSPSSAKSTKMEKKPQEEDPYLAPNLGAASLVQIWENRLSQNRPNSSGSASRSDSGLSCNEDETGNSVLDWHSERSRDSDACESERVRVADIIRRLAAVNEGGDHYHKQREPGGGSPVADHQARTAMISPRIIRGRQAFEDLLVQIERERQRELENLAESRSVSRFPQRGRIQSMLRLRSLQRGVGVQDHHQLRAVSSFQGERPPPQQQQQVFSFIPQLRERFSTKVDSVVTSQNGDSGNHMISGSEKPIHHEGSEENSEHTQIVDVVLVEQQDKTIGELSKEPCREETSLGDRILDAQETKSEDRNLGSQETSLGDRILDAQEKKSEDRNLGSQETSLHGKECTDVNAVKENEGCDDDGWDENDEASEELEDDYSQYAEEASYDWIANISRPRSYWEELRKEWYTKMLTSNSKNGDIRQLLERGTVSGFLAGEFRERMDRLLKARLQKQIRRCDGRVGGEENLYNTRSKSVTENSQEIQQQSDEEQEEDEEEEERLLGGQYHEASSYFHQPSSSSTQLSLPPLLRSWSFPQHNEVGEDSDRAVSTSPQRDFPSQSHYRSDQQHSSLAHHHPSVEIELICELRGQMEQLYHEMSDMKKSLKTCMDMQMVLMQQYSMKQELHSGGVASKEKCRVCYDRKVDSLLYRCGHMCTCLKCAHELQWNDGKCPICSAPIVDVVRAYMDP